MQWKMSGHEPVYQQIMEQLRGAVLAGEYPPGSRVPSVRELAVEAKVNPNTVQRALSELEREGLLENHGTLGRCVTHKDAVLERLRKDAVERLVCDTARRFRELGITMDRAAALLLESEKEE